MTEITTEKAEEIIGKIATIVRRTHIGTEMIVGTVTAPIVIEEHEGKEVVVAVTVKGAVVETRITGVPMPIEEERPVTVEMIEIEEVEIIG